MNIFMKNFTKKNMKFLNKNKEKKISFKFNQRKRHASTELFEVTKITFF